MDCSSYILICGIMITGATFLIANGMIELGRPALLASVFVMWGELLLLILSTYEFRPSL